MLTNELCKDLAFWAGQKLDEAKIINANTELVWFNVVDPKIGKLPISSTVSSILDRLHVQYDRYDLDCNVITEDNIAYDDSYSTMYFIDSKSLLKTVALLSQRKELRKHARGILISSNIQKKLITSHPPTRRCIAASMILLHVNDMPIVRICIYTGTVEQVCKKMSQRLSGKYTITKLLPVARKHSVFISPIEYASHYEIPYMAFDIIKDAGFGKIDQSIITWDTSRPITLDMLKDIFIQELNILSTKQTILRLEHRQ